MRDLPVEAVAAHVNEAAAAPKIGFDRVQHLDAVVFGVTARQHHAIGLQEIEALAVQILLGDDVIIAAELLQPIDDEEIEVEIPVTAGPAKILQGTMPA